MERLRSLLYVPGDSLRKLTSARSLHPDAIILDLEDGVSADRKSSARDLIRRELENAPFSTKILIRVNGLSSSFFDDDLRSSVSPLVYGIVLPKCSEPSDVARIDGTIRELEKRGGMVEGSTKLLLMIETAKGVVNSRELAKSSPRAIALIFGAEDYCADMGVARTRAGDEISLARSLIALAARAQNLDVADGVFTDFSDTAGLFEETRRVKQMGFTGKTLIHPRQIDVVHNAFAPLPEEISWAEEVVSTFEKAGGGVVVVRGKMVDEPVVAQARRILELGLRPPAS